MLLIVIKLFKIYYECLKDKAMNFFEKVGKNIDVITSTVIQNDPVVKVAKESVKVAKKAGTVAKGVDLLHSRLRKQTIETYNTTVTEYEAVASALDTNTQRLYEVRKDAIQVIMDVEHHINQLANTPKEFMTDLGQIKYALHTFENKETEIKNAELEARIAANGASGGATVGALAVAVATMGPTATMGIATTFGVASTGTAISSLSGAAATNATLAWIGGGTLAAGGGGMSAGAAFLALAGPVGWTIAGVAGVAAVGSGLFASHKNKEVADKLIAELENLEKIVHKFNNMNQEVQALTEKTKVQISGVSRANWDVKGTDYATFTLEEKQQAGFLVNSTLTLAKLINVELKINA